MSEFIITLFIPIIAIIAIFVYLFFKNDNTYNQQIKILAAIRDYGIDCIHKGKQPMVDYDDVEKYDSTLYRFWDWGYKNILPKEKYEIIKSYIKWKGDD